MMSCISSFTALQVRHRDIFFSAMQFKSSTNLREITNMSAMLLVVGVVFGYGIGPMVFKFIVSRVCIRLGIRVK